MLNHKIQNTDCCPILHPETGKVIKFMTWEEIKLFTQTKICPTQVKDVLFIAKKAFKEKDGEYFGECFISTFSKVKPSKQLSLK